MGAHLEARDGGATAILDLLRRGLELGVLDAALLPMRVPAGDSYSYVLIKDVSLLEGAEPLPPIISVQGARALSSLTRRGSDLRIAAVMRPCEARAAVELSKLDQVDLDSLVIISVDCPGALPLRDFVRDPEGCSRTFNEAMMSGDDEPMRDICRICDNAMTVSGDLHLGLMEGGSAILISNTSRGDQLLEGLEMEMDMNISGWLERGSEQHSERSEKRIAALDSLQEEIGGPQNFIRVFDNCINCHNCMRVCPVCYCRLCYFDSRVVEHQATDHLEQANLKGSLRLPTDTMLFHLGRMTHMSLTCVSCGACEDACPALIPVAQAFALVADRTQATFDYTPGRSPEDPLPLLVYREDELHEVDGE
jgi:formate dehydrogenase subunit beta